MLIFFSIVRDRAEKNNQEDCATEREPSVVDKAKKSITFLQYKTSKGKEWNSKVRGGKSKAGSSSKNEQDVLIYIRLLEWNEKERILKMKRGKKVGIRISIHVSVLNLTPILHLKLIIKLNLTKILQNN